MTAQNLIDEVAETDKKSKVDWIMRNFHYNFWIQEKTDENISNICSKIKSNSLTVGNKEE